MIKFCTLVSGSSGNAVLVSDGNTHLLVDCGLNGKQTMLSLISVGIHPDEISGILVTHEHSDHISGVGVVSRRHGIPVYANVNTWSAMERSIGKIDAKNIKIFQTDKSFEIGSIGIHAFKTPHDAASSVGYRLYVGGKKLAVATDMGHVSHGVIDGLKGSDMIILESNHDINMLKNGGYPFFLKKRILSDFGHLSNENAGDIAVTLVNGGATHVTLSHLSSENNIPKLAYHAVATALENAGISIGKDIMLKVANRHDLTSVI